MTIMRCQWGFGITVILAGDIVGVARGALIRGTEKGDELYGNNLKDTIYGYNGRDLVVGRGGADKLRGGRANDDVYGNFGKDVAYGSEGNDHLAGSYSDDQLHGGDGSDLLLGAVDFGMTGSDQLWGDQGQDILIGGHKHDVLKGGAGFDALYGGYGNDTLSPGLGGTRAVSGYFEMNNLPPSSIDFDNFISPGSGQDLVVLKTVGPNEKPVRDVVELNLYFVEADALAGRVKVVKNFNVNQDKVYISAIGVKTHFFKSRFGALGEFLSYTLNGVTYNCVHFVQRNATKILDTATVFT